MTKIQITIFCALSLLSAACSKTNGKAALADGSVSIQSGNGKDTLVQPLSILSDTTMVIDLTAQLSGKASSSGHWITFAVDTTQIVNYRKLYGNALLLPTTSYFVYKSLVQIQAGSTLSDSAQINIVQEMGLTADTTYVLPVVIQSVDNDPDISSGQVLYLVFKTGNPLFLSRAAWTIAGYSSQNSSAVAAAYVIDKDDQNTYWVSSIVQQMPQWVEIAFNSQISFSEVNYYFPPALLYPNDGGYPTSIDIQTSLDGSSWSDKGTFTGVLVNNMQTLGIGATTASYLRFTCLTSVSYFSTYNCIFISGIELKP